MKNSNKILAAFITIIISIFVFIFSVGADSVTPVLGDLNGDGLVKIFDARIALRGAVKIENLSDLQNKCGDVDFNNVVKPNDARAILRHAVKIEPLKTAPEAWFDDFIKNTSTTDTQTTTVAP